jgi:hypothetical protein
MNFQKLLKIAMRVILTCVALYALLIAFLFFTQNRPPDDGLLKLTSDKINERSNVYYPVIYRTGNKLYVADNTGRLRKEDVATQNFFLYDNNPNPNEPIIEYSMDFNCKTHQYRSLYNNNDNGSISSGSPLERVMIYACWQPPLTRIGQMFK